MQGKTTDAALLQDAGLRATPQRRAVLAVLRSRRAPSSVEDIAAAGKGRFDMTTAYRSLEALERAGIVRKVAIDEDRASFELAEGHHHHAVCTSCGVVRDISTCITPRLDEAVRKEAGFGLITKHSLEFFGMCQPCTRVSRKKP